MKLACLLALLGTVTFAQQPQRPLPEGISAKRDVVYISGGSERQRLDVFFPEKAEKPVPLIVWIHGGAWAGGTKDRCPALPFLEEGFAVASVTYRFSRHAKFPAQIEDCKAAIRWLRAHAKELNIDPDRMGAWGSSAGGHLVALLGVAGDKTEWDKGQNLEHSSKVQAVVNWFGPSNLLTMGAQSGPNSRMDHDAPGSPESQLIGGAIQENKPAATAASPVTHVSAGDSPMLLVHGDNDQVVPKGQSEELHAALKSAGVDSTLVIVPGAGHGDGGFRSATSTTAIREFFRKHLGR